MALTISRSTTGWLATLILTCCLALLTPADAVQADMLIELQTSPNTKQPAALQQSRTPDSTIALNDRGDLVIRYKEATLTIAYTLNETNAAFPSAQHNPLHHLEPPAMSGVSLALAIAF